MRSHSLLLAGALASTFTLTACGGSSDADDTGTDVIASFYPFAYVAERVGGEAINVENLTSPGVEPHDIELAPKQVASVQDADLAIFETGLQPAVDDAVAQADLSDDASLDVADIVELRELGGHEGHDHGDHEHESGEDGHDHDHGAVDPHVWLDPTKMATITDAVAGKLSEIDPDNAQTYESNAKKFKAELTKLDKAYRAGLRNCERRTIVTSHDAFGYIADRYNLKQVPIAGIEPGTEPSPSQLAEITDLVREAGVSTIFTEELVSPAVAETIADETGTEVASLDPIEGLSDETEDETYLTLMRQNLETIREANNCR